MGANLSENKFEIASGLSGQRPFGTIELIIPEIYSSILWLYQFGLDKPVYITDPVVLNSLFLTNKLKKKS